MLVEVRSAAAASRVSFLSPTLRAMPTCERRTEKMQIEVAKEVAGRDHSTKARGAQALPAAIGPREDPATKDRRARIA